MARTKTNTQNKTKTRRTPWRDRHLENTIFCVFQLFLFLFYFYLLFLEWFLNEMLSYRIGTVHDFHWEFKPVLSYSKLHIFLTFLREEKDKRMRLLTPTRPFRR